MKHELTYTACNIGLAIGLVASNALAQTTANGPYYAPPSWDQTLACTTVANCPRFVVLSNMKSDAVLDRNTGLVWQRAMDRFQDNWYRSQLQCIQSNIGGVRGWRLPTIQELMTLWDEAGYVLSNQDFHMPAGHPFSTANLRWWTATTSDVNAFFAWAAGYSATYEPITFNKENNAFAYAVCVRGEAVVSPQ